MFRYMFRLHRLHSFWLAMVIHADEWCSMEPVLILQFTYVYKKNILLLVLFT